VLDERDTDAGHEVYVRFLLHGNELRPGADEVTAAARQIVSELLGHMEIDAEVQAYYLGANSGEADTTLQVDLEGEGLALLIGRKGETLDALQYIARLILANKLDRWVRLNLDVGGYKKNREQQLRRLAQRMAQQVEQFGRPISLEPMTAYERRIIHVTLQDRPGVTTASSGEESRRRVTIEPELLR
jgi:spoIIIJ-associated protein